MVAKIKTPTSIVRALNYNEHKVQKGVAECIFAGNFLREANDINFYQKLERFEKLIALNESVKTNSLHISLNFDPADQVDKDKLIAIATQYMERLGFADQPYLVYQHHDAGHPHIHIVTTTIQPSGKRIDTYNIGKIQSEAARKEIEATHNLVLAEGRKKSMQHSIQPVNIQRPVYGKCETKQAITNVLSAVIDGYKYTSLAEFNAVLKQYNVVADRGNEGSVTFKKRGLFYRIVDQQGNKIGVPIKASSIYNKPTLDALEKKFAANEIKRKPDLKRIKTCIDWTLARKQTGLHEFVAALKNERISTIIRQNSQGLVYGLTFIDYQTKAVFNGSDIGKEYSAKGIMDRLSNNQPAESKTIILDKGVDGLGKKDLAGDDEISMKMSKAIETLLQPASHYDQVPAELKEQPKRRKKKSHHH